MVERRLGMELETDGTPAAHSWTCGGCGRTEVTLADELWQCDCGYEEHEEWEEIADDYLQCDEP